MAKRIKTHDGRRLTLNQFIAEVKAKITKHARAYCQKEDALEKLQKTPEAEAWNDKVIDEANMLAAAIESLQETWKGFKASVEAAQARRLGKMVRRGAM